MKRKLDDITENKTISKKRKLIKFVSASSTRNYLLNDTLSDWLSIYEPDKEEKSEFLSHILNQGDKFEKFVINYIKNNICDVVTVTKDYKITNELCEKTKELINKKIPILHSVPLRNYSDNTQGIADLLVRNDYAKFFGIFEDVKSEYIIIDIKYCRVSLTTDSKHILNCNSFPAYKGQLLIYNKALKDMTGIDSNICAILGRGIQYTKKGIVYFYNNFEEDNPIKTGMINYSSFDSDYIEKTKSAVNWLRYLDTEGSSWSVLPIPSNIYLYPNLTCHSFYSKRKKEIANEIKDITQIWKCGIQARNNAFQHGVFSWEDKDCNSSVLKVDKRIDCILNINRQNVCTFSPNKIKNNLYNWKIEDNEMFVDFETLPQIFSFDYTEFNGLFLIGTLYKGEYKEFCVKEFTWKEQQRISQEFVNYIISNNSPKIWYWYAEKNIWRKTEENLCDKFDNMENIDNIAINWNLEWCDLYEIFIKEPIVVKDCFTFTLKDVAKALYKHDLISVSYKEEMNGMDASVIAYKAINSGSTTNLNRVIDYNKTDVVLLCEIINFIRKRK